MSWFTNLFSSGVDKVISSVGDAVDSLVTSDEERLQLKNELQQVLNKHKVDQLKHVETLEQQVTDRHSNDMKSDSRLSKNIRPLTLAFLTVATTILAYATIFADLTVLQNETLKSWIPLLQVLLVTSFSFYFGGRVYREVYE